MRRDYPRSSMTVKTFAVVNVVVKQREGGVTTMEAKSKVKAPMEAAMEAEEIQVIEAMEALQVLQGIQAVQVARRATPGSSGWQQELVPAKARRRDRDPPWLAVALVSWFMFVVVTAGAGIDAHGTSTSTTTTTTTGSQQRQILQQPQAHLVAQTATAPAPVTTTTEDAAATAMQKSEPVAAAVLEKLEERTLVSQTHTNITTATAPAAAAGAISTLRPLPGVVGTFPHDLAAYWSFNDSFHLSHLDEFDHTHFEGAGVPVNMDVSGTGGGGGSMGRASSRVDGPVFDNNLVTNVTAQLGGPAFLRCRVRNLGERPVSWIRRRDWHILTSGVFTYTNDERFQVVHSAGGDEWTLHIKYVQKRDNGTYECQVATGGGVMSHYFNLHVVVPAAFILGSGEYHIGEGSTISLVCIIENSPSPPQYVFWYHNENMINYDNLRGGVTVSTEPGPKTHSRLIINQATRADSGNYTCRASNTEADTIYVFVSKGDNTAAIQRQGSAAPDALRRPSIYGGSIQRLWAVLAAAVAAAMVVPFVLRPMELGVGTGAR